MLQFGDEVSVRSLHFGISPVRDMRLIDLYDRFHHTLWEEGRHKINVLSFIEEIDSFLVGKLVDFCSDSLVDELIQYYRERGNRNSTINRKLAALYKLLRRANKAGLIAKLPSYVRLPENNARIRFLSYNEEAAFFARLTAADSAFGDLFVFLIDTGARIGEALALTHADVHNGRATFWITKSGRSRTVPMTKRAREAVERQASVPGGPFKRVRYQNFLYTWNKIKKEIGLGDDKQVVPHILRHTCASRLVQAGIDLRRVQAFLGHQTIQMTLRYAHLATDDLDQCVIALDRTVEKNAKTAAKAKGKSSAKRKPQATKSRGNKGKSCAEVAKESI